MLSSLPKKQAAGLLERLTAAEAAAVRREMAGIGRLGRRRRETVLREFAACAAGCATMCATASQKQCNDEPPGTACSKQWHTGETPSGSTFQFLHGIEVEDLLALLADEHPQTVALILSHLPAQQAADALGAMPPELQTPVIRRIATIEEPGVEIVQDVEEAIRRRLSAAGDAKTSVGITSVVKMLGAMPPASERLLLDELAQADSVLLGNVRRAMFGADVADCETASV